MITTVIRQIRPGPIAALLVLVAVAGCQGPQVSYEGTTATQEDNVMLKEGGPHEGRWEDSSIIVNYTFNNQPSRFEFFGTVDLARRLENTYRTVNNFSVRANFLGEEKIVVKSVPIIIAGNQPIRTWRFTYDLDLPPNARFINFSYSGRAAEGGTMGRGGDGTDTFFWRVP